MKELARKAGVVLAVLVAVGCAAYLIWYYILMPDPELEDEYKKPVTVETEEKEKIEIPVDFEALKQVNPDVCGWIRIEGTEVDYPVVRSQEDDEYYLNRSWEKQPSAAGAIFIQAYNRNDFSDYNTVIYGHRMGNNDHSMFHDIHGYMDQNFLKEHDKVVIYTPEHIRTYQVFAAVVYDDRLLPVAYDFGEKEQRREFLDSIYQANDLRNQYNDAVEVTEEDKIITLSTCLASEPNHRYLVGAVLIEEK